MKPELLRVLLVEDSPDDAELVLRAARGFAAQVQHERVMTGKDMHEALKKQEWDIVISDFNLPAFSGYEAIETLKSTGIDIPLILVSGTIGEATAVTAVKRGASDYVLKNNLGRLPSAIEYALREKKTAQENRLLASQLAQAQKMEAIGRLAGGLAHDVNNVLAAISLCAELAAQQITQGNVEGAGQNLKNILRAQESGAGIIRQLLVFSKRQVGQTVVLDFCSVVLNMQPLLRRLIGENVELTVEFKDESIAVAADPAQIEQIMLNLAINARDAMTNGGKLQFILEKRTVDILPANVRIPCRGTEFAVLTATDSGCGMPPEVLQNIFEPFFTTKAVDKGTGLGLSVVYGIIQRLGGTMAVESSPSRGTTFQIFWPLSREPIETAAVTEHALKDLGGQKSARVLLVEDGEDLRQALADTLRTRGFEVHEAIHGKEGIKILVDQKYKIDLIITDVIMPQMGGVELVNNARKINPGVKVLFLSGHASSQLENCELDGAFTWFLEKPFTSATFFKKISEILHVAPYVKASSN